MTAICRISDHKETKLKFPYESNHKYINNIEYKLCSDCNEWHPLNEDYFYKNKTSPDGHNPYCKEATIRRSRSHQDANKERHSKNQMKYAKTPKGKKTTLKESRKWRSKGGQREYYKQNKNKYFVYGIRNKTIKNHDITDEEWYSCLDYFKNSCAYCGLSEEKQINTFNEQFHREHVIPSGSNFIDNCVPSCTRCNTSKHDFEFNDWYNESNENYAKRRSNKIINWMTKECFKVLNLE